MTTIKKRYESHSLAPEKDGTIKTENEEIISKVLTTEDQDIKKAPDGKSTAFTPTPPVPISEVAL
jgi:hypothetical protein